MTSPVKTGYAPVNGLKMYYEIYGEGEPLVLLHGGFGLTSMMSEVIPAFAKDHQVIATDLQGHGRTEDIDRPLSLAAMADDVAGLMKYLGFDKVNVMGYSMGGGTATRLAIQHPELVKRLVAVSIPFKRTGWYAEMLPAMDQMGSASFEFFKNTPMYQAYVAVAPKPENFPKLMDQMGNSMRRDYDWSSEIKALKMPVLIVVGDADGFSPAYAAEMFALLGGGLRDGSWDNSGMSNSRLAILPATTHYNIFMSPLLPAVVLPFLDAPLPEAK